MADPVRRCAGCGRSGQQRDLVRFAVRDGELVVGRDEPGRGAYTCRRLRCFERARAGGGFARALRVPVRVDPALAGIYTGESHG
jgi:uncharacterized protein